MTSRVALIVVVFLSLAIFGSDAHREHPDQCTGDALVDSWEKVRQLPARSVYGRSYSSEKKVALTFDDGPFEKHTEQTLDILGQHQIKATFFLLGVNMEKHPEIVKRMVHEGHAVGNHSYNHADFRLLTKESAYTDQIEKTQEIFHQLLGNNPSSLRPPYGAITCDQAIYFYHKGLKTILWSISTYDWDPQRNSVESILTHIAQKEHAGAILLLHDIPTNDVFLTGRNPMLQALPDIIKS